MLGSVGKSCCPSINCVVERRLFGLLPAPAICHHFPPTTFSPISPARPQARSLSNCSAAAICALSVLSAAQCLSRRFTISLRMNGSYCCRATHPWNWPVIASTLPPATTSSSPPAVPTASSPPRESRAASGSPCTSTLIQRLRGLWGKYRTSAWGGNAACLWHPLLP